jgi:osmotically-inducible protein OsmY
MTTHAHPEHRLIRADARVKEDVLRELRWDTRVEETDVGVETDEGVVTLTGTVTSYAKRVAAQEAAHHVDGGRDVVNNIQVHVPGSHQRTDTEIAIALRRALESDAHVPADLIETTVADGVVTLGGAVGGWSQRLEAERVVHRQVGVRGVINTLTVRGPLIEPVTLREAIQEALERRAEREARDIHVEVVGSTVVLDGYVPSWRVKRAIIGAVAHAPGIAEVEDRLVIDPYR